jgi:hypothetical protein
VSLNAILAVSRSVNCALMSLFTSRTDARSCSHMASIVGAPAPPRPPLLPRALRCPRPASAPRPDAILGVALFKDLVPASFAQFNLAFVAMFRVAAGETWIDGLPLVDEDGAISWKAAIFVCSYLVINVWVILQVCRVGVRSAP